MTERTCKRCGSRMSPGGALQGMCTTCLLELGFEEDSHVVITGTSEAPAPPPSPAELQPLFPDHTIEAILGQGGMGVVYRAVQKGLDRPVALKVLPAKAGRDPSFAERFTREARALASLNHPNITAVYDFGKAGDHYWLAMELVDGVNLRQLLSGERVSPKQALQIVEQICDALQYAHDEGVVHRDIKPENILLDRRGNLKITDFGLAKMLGREEAAGPTGLTMTHQVMGTPHYMAPEQIEHPSTVDHRADIYSLGVVFYELLTGELPLGRFAPPSGKVQVDVKLDEVVLRTLEKEPALRYQTASAVKDDVHDFSGVGIAAGAAAAGRAAAAPPSMDSAREPRKKSPWVWILALLLIVPMLLFLAFVLLLAPASIGRVEQKSARVQRAMEPPPPEPPLRLDRLEGVDIVERQPNSTLELTLAFRNVYEVSPEVAAELGKALTEVARDYVKVLEAHMTYEYTGELQGRVTIESFPEQDRELEDRFLRQARALLSPMAFEALVARDPLRTAIQEDGRRDKVYDIRLEGDSYVWETRVGGRTFRSGPAPELPSRLEYYWEKLYQPLGPSVVPAIVAVAERLKEFGSIRTSSIRTAPPAPGSESGVLVRFDAEIQDPDSDAASQLLERFAASLEEAGCTVSFEGLERTRARGTTIDVLKVNDVRITTPAEAPLVRVLGEGGPSDVPGLLLELARTSETIEYVDITPSSPMHSPRIGELAYQVRPRGGDSESTPSLTDLIAWLSAVEDADERSVVSAVTLKARGSSWSASIEVRARKPR